MLQRAWHALFGHQPIIRITQIRANPDAEPQHFPDPQLFYCAKFGATTIGIFCPCGRGSQQVLFGREIPVADAGLDKEIAELRRMAKL